VKNLIEITNFNFQILKKSENYGDIIVTKIATINLLDALKDSKLEYIHKFYSELRKNLGFFYLEILDEEFIIDQYIRNYDVYTPLRQHNFKVKAIGHTEKSVKKIINKIISKNKLQDYITYLW
jgi:hypothetical protein